MDSEGRRIAECFGVYSQDMDSKANAAYIVECVNAHERLVDLVRRMIRPVETTLEHARKEGAIVKIICRSDEACKTVESCIKGLEALLDEARAALGKEAGNG